MSRTRYEKALNVGANRPPRCPITGEHLTPVACDCDPPRAHGVHWRRVASQPGKLRRLTERLAHTQLKDAA